MGCALATTAALGPLVPNPGQASVYVPSDRLWPEGVVPFVWAADMPFPNRLQVVAAMNVWSDVANVQFVPRTDETDYIYIRNAEDGGGSKSPDIGRAGGEQDLFIRVDLTDISVHGLAHELGHVLGFHHTHQRPDRDDFLIWYEERTAASGVGNFTIKKNALAYPRNAMDYDSVMSYGPCIFSACGQSCGDDLDDCRVLEIKDPVAAAEFDAGERRMGQRNYLTRIDALVMSFLYPQMGWLFVEKGYADTAEEGTFHDPFLQLDTALNEAAKNATVWIQPGWYPVNAGVIDQSITLRAPRGGVLLTKN